MSSCILSCKPEYVPLTSQPDGESSDVVPVLVDLSVLRSSGLSLYIFWTCLAVTLLSILNVLLPSTLSSYHLSESQLELPYPDQRLGLDRAAKAMPITPSYLYTWPEQIARLSQKLKNAVYGSGTEVFISAEDSTIMRFHIPSNGTNTCAIIWHPQPALGARNDDLETKGDITEIEVWSIIAPNPIVSPGASLADLDFDTLSWDTRPVRGELLGTLDLTARPNATTVDFACPPEAEGLTVELRCLRVACHVRFMQVPFVPKIGFELARRQ